MGDDKNKRKIDFSKGEAISPDFSVSKKQRSLTIDDLEKAINLFRESGSEAELGAFIKEITREIGQKNTEKQIDAQRAGINVYIKENPFAGLLNFIKEKFDHDELKEPRKNNYFRHTAIIFAIFFSVYIAFNIPIYYNRVSYIFSSKTEIKIIKYSEVEQAANAKSAPFDPGEVAPAGSALVIPQIGINAPIVTVDSFEEAKIQEGLKSGVVRLGPMSSPGQVGNTFITGHSSNFWWDKGKYNYVFVLLDKVQVGENIKVYDNGNKFIYEVTGKEIVDPSNTSTIVHTDEPTLTLMTCYPPGSTSKRLLVKLKQTSPIYNVPKVVEKQKTVEIPKKLPSNDRNSFWDAFRALFWH